MEDYTTTFDQWLSWVFDHPVADPAWYWGDDYQWLEPPECSEIAAHFLNQLFESPALYLDQYSDGQLNQGLQLIIDPGISSHFFALLDDRVPADKRIRGMRATYNIFSSIFAHRCTAHLGHRNEMGDSPLNTLCYMWWDICPFNGGRKEVGALPVSEAAKTAMEKTLYIDHDACRESALHGLGHLALYQERECSDIIDRFLNTASGLRPQLAEYAKCARKGCVQ